MGNSRYSIVSIDSLIDQDSNSHQMVDNRQYATVVDVNRADSMTYDPSVGPHHRQQPWQTSTTSYEHVLKRNTLPVNLSPPESGFARRVSRMWNYGWVLECLSCGLAVIALIAIVITLRLHENKSLPKWLFNISINALIAIFGVLLRAGVTVPLSEGLMLSPPI